ncbi:kinase-like domain-containing protein [Mycena floridula]|nr:kinase-like domain-containing protein [Mycena floridula]
MADYEISPMLRHSREDPKMIGAWKIGRTLGRGTSDAEYQALSLQREIVIMKLIDHPHVLRLYDVWDASNELYLILEYVQGGELFEYMITKGRLSYSEALGYFQQIIAGVHYCHRFNIAHRDLKPENILLDSHMNIKIADFGMAVWQSGAMNHTSCGSPHYAAPEIVSGAAYDGAAADVWSCGLVKLPFDDDDTNNLLQKVCIGKFDMPPDIPNPVQDLLSRMLTKDAKKRITMAAIEQHPFFKSQKPKVIEHDMPSLDNIARPVSSRRDIDPELFKSLQTLWHGTDDEELIDSLMNKERNWQKGVYYLLDEKTRAADRQRRLPGPDSYIPFSPSSIPPRDGRLSSSSSQDRFARPDSFWIRNRLTRHGSTTKQTVSLLSAYRASSARPSTAAFNISDGFEMISADAEQQGEKRVGKKVQILRKRKTLSPVSPTSPTFTSTLSPSSPLPSSPVTWLATSYSLLSECRRLLMEMNALVMLEDSEGLGDIKDPTGSIGIHKSVKCPRKEPGDRRMFSLLMVQEKGSLETFKEVYSRMKRDWA